MRLRYAPLGIGEHPIDAEGSVIMPVKGKSRRQLTALSEPLLEPGDRILHMVIAQVGKAPVKKNVAAFALSLVVAIVVGALGGGSTMVWFHTKAYVYVVVTDRSLLVFGRRNGSRPGRLLGNMPRHAITLTRVTGGLTRKIRFRIDGSAEEVRLSFPPLNPGARGDARDLVALLGGPPPHPGPGQGGGESRQVPRGSGGGHRAARGKWLGAMLSGLSWWQAALVLLPLTLIGIDGALGGIAGGAAAGANAVLARRKRHGAALTALSMICVDALACGVYFGGVAVLLSKPVSSSQATPSVTPTPQRTPHILPTGDAFTPAVPAGPPPPGVTLNAPSVLRSTGATLSWPAYVNTSGSAAYDITAYEVYRTTSDQSQTKLLASLAPGSTSFADATAVNPYGGNVYYYMVGVRTRSGVVIDGTPLQAELTLPGQTQISIPAVASGTLSDEYPNTVFEPHMPVGSNQPEVEVGILGGLGATRAVFGFGALNEALPGGAVVVEAHLSLLDTWGGPPSASANYTLYGLSRSFTASQATWNSAAPGIPWTKPGGDYATTPAGIGPSQDQADSFRWDFDATAIVRGWISDPGSEHGLLLREDYETDPQQVAYFGAAGDRVPSVQCPVLVITYTVSGSAGTAK